MRPPDRFVRLGSIDELHRGLGLAPPEHPLLSVIDYAGVRSEVLPEGTRVVTDLYLASFKASVVGELRYGRERYDFAEGSLLFMAPGQTFDLAAAPGEPGMRAEGWGVYFDPDLIAGTPLGQAIAHHTYFGYEVREALHVSAREREALKATVANLRAEAAARPDAHSRALLVANLEVLLTSCRRFYDRQFHTRAHAATGVVARFHALVREYYRAGRQVDGGPVTLAALAAELHLSPNYLSDLVSKQTGATVTAHVQDHVLQLAKHRLLAGDASVGEVAYGLGFSSPQYFSRLFRARTGLSPTAWRRA